MNNIDKSDDAVFSGEWVVVFAGGDRRFIGKITYPSVVKDLLEDGGVITLNPVFDYMLQLMQQGAQIAKAPLVLPFDMCSDQVNFHVKPIGYILFKDMSEDDRKNYQDLVRAAMAMNETAKRGKRSNIEIAKTLPPSLGGR